MPYSIIFLNYFIRTDSKLNNSLYKLWWIIKLQYKFLIPLLAISADEMDGHGKNKGTIKSKLDKC